MVRNRGYALAVCFHSVTIVRDDGLNLPVAVSAFPFLGSVDFCSVAGEIDNDCIFILDIWVVFQIFYGGNYCRACCIFIDEQFNLASRNA